MTTDIVLVGNGRNDNRGCEAIARGTHEIFNKALGVNARFSSGVIMASNAPHLPPGTPPDDLVPQFPITPTLQRGLSDKVKERLLGLRKKYEFPNLDTHTGTAELILEVGGDNYTLDYGRPYTFLDLDDHLMKSHRTPMIWGASIGPFDSDAEFEPVIIDHFSSLKQVFVRETVSFTYLKNKGLQNVTLMADPAVVMVPEKPDTVTWDVERSKGAIGLNLSPFQARQLNQSKKEYWETSASELEALAIFGAKLVEWLVDEFDREVVLVPHVMASHNWNNDHTLLKNVLSKLDSSKANRVQLLPDNLNAPQTKWAVSHFDVFAGSRTHSTLAGLSSGVPTLAFGYSRKAIGLMKDMYGSDKFCLMPGPLSDKPIKDAISYLFENREDARNRIAQTLPKWKESAYAAGAKALSLLD